MALISVPLICHLYDIDYISKLHLALHASKRHNRQPLLLQEGRCVWDVFRVKFGISLKQLSNMQVAVFAQLAQLCLAQLALHRTKEVLKGCR